MNIQSEITQFYLAPMRMNWPSGCSRRKWSSLLRLPWKRIASLLPANIQQIGISLEWGAVRISLHYASYWNGTASKNRFRPVWLKNFMGKCQVQLQGYATRVYGCSSSCYGNSVAEPESRVRQPNRLHGHVGSPIAISERFQSSCSISKEGF